MTIDRDTAEASYEVNGNAKPTGMHGSGMIDAIAEMYLSAGRPSAARYSLI